MKTWAVGARAAVSSRWKCVSLVVAQSRQLLRRLVAQFNEWMSLVIKQAWRQLSLNINNVLIERCLRYCFNKYVLLEINFIRFNTQKHSLVAGRKHYFIALLIWS